MDVSDDNWGSKNTSIWLPQGKTAEEYKCVNFAMKTASKIQILDCNGNCRAEYK